MAIGGIERLDETTVRLDCNGDNWHMTWAGDGRTFAGLCDGFGWPGMPGYGEQQHNTRVIALQGEPPNVRFEHLPGFPDLLTEESPRRSRYYGFGILALEGAVYQFLSTPNRPFGEPEPRFCGAKLVYSPDNGRTWRNQDGSDLRWEGWGERSRENMAFLREDGDAFSLLTVLQMGRNYEHNRDGYVYVYAPNGSAEGAMNQLVMFRVRGDRILDRSAYEYFAGPCPDGTAAWTSDITQRGIVHTFPSGWVNTQIHPYAWHPSVVYNAPLGVYMMANWGMGCSADGMWFGKPSYLGFWTAPNPWGPWTQIHEDTCWTPCGDQAARAYQPQIAPQWISPDGRSFWLVFTDFQVIDGARPYYRFNCQEVRILEG